VQIRPLARHEIPSLRSIDRSELVENVYSLVDGALVLHPERHDVKGWPSGALEQNTALVLDCLDHGGVAWGAFDGDALVGAAALESRFIGRARDRLQLKFLHVGRAQRRTGLGCALFELAVARARELGARMLYISATPSENTIGFYLRRGCRLAAEVDPELFALEPEDIHLELAIPD
jgi:predicted N-acetyltransferase YhbS